MTSDPNNPPPPPGGYPPPPQGGYSPPDAAQGAPPPAAGPTPSQDRPSGPAPGIDEHGKVQRGRISAIWVGLIIAALLLVALLIFIAQNSRTVVIHFLGFSGHLSLAVALLASAVIGILLVAIPGTARIVQLRRALKKNA